MHIIDWLGEEASRLLQSPPCYSYSRTQRSARKIPCFVAQLQMAIDYANTRVTFGKPIAERQAIQWMIADSHVEIEATRWLALHAAWLAEQKMEVRHAASIAKLYGANMANREVDRVLQIHGGMGYTKELPVECWYREMRVWRIFEGTDEIQRFIIAHDLLRGYVKVGNSLQQTKEHVFYVRSEQNRPDLSSIHR